jgi:hypothetical protein
LSSVVVLWATRIASQRLSSLTVNGWLILETPRNNYVVASLILPIHLDFVFYRIVPSVLKGVVACTAIRHGGELEWNFAFKRFRQSNVASEKATLLSSLTCTQESWILARLVFADF